MISEAEVELAVSWLRDNAEKAGQAKAERMYVEEYKKSLEAELMLDAEGSTVKEREAKARCHPKYIAHLQAIKEAVKADEAMRWMMTAAETKVSAWQTQCKVAMAEGRAYQ